MSRRAVDELRRASDFHRYLRGLRAWVGFRQLALPIERDSRHGGKPKYGLLALVRLALDGVFSFSVLPLRLATVTGALAVLLAGGFGLYAIYAALVLDRSPQGFTAQLLTIVFLSGVNLFFLGVIGEYVGRIYEQSKARPLYVVENVIGTTTRPTGERQ
jgi:dolichol-phosphate mannosyltransferase